MKKLYLMRHAKSSWKLPLKDFERPLNKRGKKASKTIGKYFRENSIEFNLIIASSAKRAKDTAKRVAKAMGLSKDKILLEPKLYEVDTKEVIELIKNLDSNLNSVLIIAHNPQISDTVVTLSKDDSFSWLPTAGVVGLKFDTDRWDKIEAKEAKVFLYIAPKLIE